MRRHYPFLFVMMFFCVAVTAQQSQLASQYSMYMLNKYAFNPAYAGLDNSLSLTGVIRTQWTGLDGNPITQNANAHLPLYILRGGFGINIENEVLGAERNTSASASYNFWLPLSEKRILTIGMGGGIIQKSLDGAKLRSPDGQYTGGTINHRDPYIPTGKETALVPTFSAGIYYQSPSIEIGFSTNNFSASDFQISTKQDTVARINTVQNYFAIFAGKFTIGDNFAIIPSIFTKSDFRQTQMEFSTIVKYDDNIFGGVSFRGYESNSIDALAIIAGFNINEHVTLAYSYDVSLSQLNTVNGGSHEVMINYNHNRAIGNGRLPKIIYNPRFL